MVLRGDEENLTNFCVVGPKWGMMYGGFILHMSMLELEVLISTRTKNCLPAHVETK